MKQASSTLFSRLNVAISRMRIAGHKDSVAAIEEAKDVIRALPFAESINDALYSPNEREAPLLLGNLDQLRDLRKWHYSQYLDYSKRANDVDRRMSICVLPKSVADRERLSGEYRSRANQHLRFVRVLNDFFPTTDRIA